MKVPVLVALGVGVAGILITVLVLYFGNLGDNGVFVVAGTSSILMSLRAFFFIPIYSAYLLKQKWTTFFPSMIRGWIAFFVLLGIFLFVKSLIGFIHPKYSFLVQYDHILISQLTMTIVSLHAYVICLK